MQKEWRWCIYYEMENNGSIQDFKHKLLYSSVDTNMEVTKCQLEIIIPYATDTEVEQLKSALMTEEFIEVLLEMLTKTPCIYNRLVAQEIWVALATVGMVILVLAQELR